MKSQQNVLFRTCFVWVWNFFWRRLHETVEFDVPPADINDVEMFALQAEPDGTGDAVQSSQRLDVNSVGSKDFQAAPLGLCLVPSGTSGHDNVARRVDDDVSGVL